MKVQQIKKTLFINPIVFPKGNIFAIPKNPNFAITKEYDLRNNSLKSTVWVSFSIFHFYDLSLFYFIVIILFLLFI